MSMCLLPGGWKENWDDAPKFFALKAGKGHIRERSRSLRADKITKAMKSMPDKIAKYRQVRLLSNFHIYTIL